MKNLGITFIFLAPLTVATGAAAQTLDWQTLDSLKPNTWISVETHKRIECSFQSADSDKLYCRTIPENWLTYYSLGWHEVKQKDLVFNRAEIREMHILPVDDSQGPFAMMLAAGGGGGWDSNGQTNGFAGIKIGGPYSVDLQYDRIQGHNGFSTEGSAVLPIFRFPQFQENRKGRFVKIFAEPGVGYRAGDGPYGGYSSAKAMAVLLSDKSTDWAAPYIEYQRRFPFGSPLQGDNRLTFGWMIAFCIHCGID
ncbi:MAG: hypothetical protein WB424_16090 [Terracidiphilus sp.]